MFVDGATIVTVCTYDSMTCPGTVSRYSVPAHAGVNADLTPRGRGRGPEARLCPLHEGIELTGRWGPQVVEQLALLRDNVGLDSALSDDA